MVPLSKHSRLLGDRPDHNSLCAPGSLCVWRFLTLQSWNVHTDFMRERDVQRARAAQVGQLMRSYRESFEGGGRRGLTQEALLERMGSVDSDYAERYSHATVSRWESGGTRPTLQRLKVFGQALNLSQTDVAGLVLLAGLAPDFPTALGHISGSNGTNGNIAALVPASGPGVAGIAGALRVVSTPSILRSTLRFVALRILPLGMAMVGGYASAWLPAPPRPEAPIEHRHPACCR